MKSSGPGKLSTGPPFFEGRHLRGRPCLPEKPPMEPDDPTHLGLLAVLHRDGGHFTDAHGIEHATRVAIAQWYADQRELEELRRWRAQRDERTVSWGAVREATDSTWAALELAEQLIGLGFAIEDFPGRP